MPDRRATASQRGYGAAWRRRAAAQLERQPWCEVCLERAWSTAPKGDPHAYRLAFGLHRPGDVDEADARWFVAYGVSRANTVDHRKPRRRFPLELQGSDEPGGSEHPDNLRSLCGGNGHGTGTGTCHNRRREDKAR